MATPKRPMSPREMKRMRGQMKTEELEGVEEVIIRLEDKDIVIPSPQVSKIILGGEIYQVVGSGIEREKGSTGVEAAAVAISEDDVKLIMNQTGASEEEARNAIEEEKGDLAGAIMRLKTKK